MKIASVFNHVMCAAAILCALSGPPVALAQGADTAVFTLEIDPIWKPLPGDPLPVSFRLSCPKAQGQALLWLDEHQGDTNTPPVFSPAVKPNWPEGLNLVLARIETNGQRTMILTGAQWQTYSDNPVANFEPAEGNIFTRSKKFWLPPAAAQLVPGTYALEADWRGTNYIDPALLPGGGIVSASSCRLEVPPILLNSERALHAERLARQAYRDGDKPTALNRAMEAIALEPELAAEARADTYLLAALTALQLKDTKTSVQVLQALVGQLPAEDPTGLRADLLSSLALLRPRLKVESAGGIPRLKVQGTPGQTYVTMASSDLKTWTPVSTNTATDGVFVVEDPQLPALQKRFYRALGILP